MNKNIFHIYFSIVFILSSYLFIKIFWPYLTPFILALIFSVIFHPAYKWFKKQFKNRDAIASIATCFVVILIVIMPIATFLGLVSKEAFDIFEWAKDKLNTEQVELFLTENRWISKQIEYAQGILNIDLSPDQLKNQLGSIGKNVGLFIYEQITKLFSNIFRMVFYFILFIFILFYFFKDGNKIAKKIMDLSPLSDEHELRIINKFKEVGNAVFWGNLVAAFMQGLTGGLGFIFFGLGNGFLWGFIIALLSLIPAVGTLVVAIPAGVYLIIKGKVFSGIGFLIYQVIFSNLIDNVIKPKMIESKMKIHPLLVFFSIMGGVSVFGLLGILYGPLIVTVFLSIVEIYEMDIIKKRKKVYFN